MSRSISYPNGAIVAFTILEVERTEDRELEYEWLRDDLTERAAAAFPSLLPHDGWRGREDQTCCATPMPTSASRSTAASSRCGSPSATTAPIACRLQDCPVAASTTLAPPDRQPLRPPVRRL
jgi:hypothetical protein